MEPRWNAPHIDADLGVAYDLDDLESQPRVAAGDWLTLGNGDRVVLRSLPVEAVSSDLRVLFKGGPPPEVLYFKHEGRWHIGALNGRSLVGVVPVVNTYRTVLELLARKAGAL